MQDLGFRVEDPKAWGLGFCVWDLWFRASGLEFGNGQPERTE